MNIRRKFLYNASYLNEETESERLERLMAEEQNRLDKKYADRLQRKHNIQDALKNHGKKIGYGTAALATGAGIAYGIKKFREKQKEKKRLENLHTQKRLEKSKPNESYRYNVDSENLNEFLAAKGIGLIGSIVGAGLGVHSLYKAFTSGDDASRAIQNIGYNADNLRDNFKREIDANIKKIHDIIPRRLIKDVMFSEDISVDGVIIINNENELCRYFASRSYNNKTNEGIILYVLELFKQKKMQFNIITYDFFTKYYNRSLTKALSNNESNENCYNCFNCDQCEFCIDCINCINCKYCIDCTNCRTLENADRKRNTNKNVNNYNDDNDNISHQLMLQYGISSQELENQIRIVIKRTDDNRQRIGRLYLNKREQDIERSKLPKTASEFKAIAIQELINKRKPVLQKAM